MWRYFGVFVNVATVLLGSCLGLLLRRRARGTGHKTARTDDPAAREPLPQAMMACLGLCTIFAAVSGLTGIQGGGQALIVVASMVGGLFVGWLVRLEDRINRLGDRVAARFGGEGNNPAEGFVTACLLYCIGSMTVLGSFESAANPVGALALDSHTTLLIKSMMDCVSSTCLAATFGASVMASALAVLAVEGGLVTLAAAVQPFLERIGAMAPFNCAGSLVLLVIAMNLLGVKKLKTADYLPALFMPVVICWLLSLMGISV